MMELTKLWQTFSEENKLLLKGTVFAALGLYILLQLATLILPLAIISGFSYWTYKVFIDKNPKIFK